MNITSERCVKPRIHISLIILGGFVFLLQSQQSPDRLESWLMRRKGQTVGKRVANMGRDVHHQWLGLLTRAIYIWKMEGRLYNDTRVLKKTRILWVALVSGGDVGKTWFLWKCWTCFLCQDSIKIVQPLPQISPRGVTPGNYNHAQIVTLWFLHEI